MNKLNNSFKVTDFSQKITLYEHSTQTDDRRQTHYNALSVVAHFKAMIDAPFYTKPEASIVDIYHIKHVYVRVSNFYRPHFKKNNYIKDHEAFLRIASVKYNLYNGVICCVCYDSDPIAQNIRIQD